jgi:putative acetyltransferase
MTGLKHFNKIVSGSLEVEPQRHGDYSVPSIRQIDPGEVQDLIAALDEYQSALYPAESNHLDSIEELRSPHVCMIGLFDQERPVAIGAIKFWGDYGEIKRVYVHPDHRGKGYAKTIMQELERRLVNRGITTARLEAGIKQYEAISLYRRYGYEQRGPFGAYAEDPLSLFMEKQLNGQPEA